MNVEQKKIKEYLKKRISFYTYIDIIVIFVTNIGIIMLFSDIMEMFISKDLPYKALEELGISKEAFLNLPTEILDRILTGRLSPLLRLTLESNDQLFNFDAKIAFERVNNDVELKVYPIKKEIGDEIPLTKGEKSKLMEGEIIKKKISKDGKNHSSFIQLDKETNTLMSVLCSNVYIPSSINKYTLSKKDKEVIKSGKPLEIETDCGKITIGVDLESKSGIRKSDGTLQKWEMDRLMEWDRLNPTVKGYWITSDNNWEYKEENNIYSKLKF